VNLDLLGVLPPHREAIAHGKPKREQIIRIDPTGNALGLTPYGHLIMQSWFQNNLP
jgi:hypothetical protein